MLVAGLRNGRRLVAAAAVVVVLVIAGALVVACYRAQGPEAARAGSGQGSATSPGTTSLPASPVAAFPPSLRGQDITVLPTTRKVVALTFDAGGEAKTRGLSKILTVLADQRVPATFFVTGDWVTANPAGISAIRAAGHRVGNHSMTHPSSPSLPAAAISDQVLDAQRTIQAAGLDPRPLFRFPYGDRDARTIATVNNLGYLTVRWTVDTLGWKGTSAGIAVQQVSDRAVGALRPGEIVLMHVDASYDSSTLDADALPDIIARIRAAGYEFVTLDTLYHA
jgi:peptidoglycan-N-acetylglucosamine deacetylase